MLPSFIWLSSRIRKCEKEGGAPVTVGSLSRWTYRGSNARALVKPGELPPDDVERGVVILDL